MTALDLINDFGERLGRDGKLLDEFGAVLVCFPPDAVEDAGAVVLAGAITRNRCDGRGDVAEALAAWSPEPEALQ